MNEKKFIEDGWDGYRKMVVSREASDIQVIECRRAFYAGVSVLFETLMLVLQPDKDKEEELEAGMEMLASLQAEIDEFGRALDLELLPPGGHG